VTMALAFLILVRAESQAGLTRLGTSWAVSAEPFRCLLHVRRYLQGYVQKSRLRERCFWHTCRFILAAEQQLR
jgi:hypothetical protein